MKATLTFTLPEEETEYQCAIRGQRMAAALEQVGQEVFRPARKHGYPDQALNALLEKEGVAEAIEKLEALFWGILEENGANPDAF